MWHVPQAAICHPCVIVRHGESQALCNVRFESDGGNDTDFVSAEREKQVGLGKQSRQAKSVTDVQKRYGKLICRLRSQQSSRATSYRAESKPFAKHRFSRFRSERSVLTPRQSRPLTNPS